MNAAELLRAVIFVLKSRSGHDSVDKNGVPFAELAAPIDEREGEVCFPGWLKIRNCLSSNMAIIPRLTETGRKLRDCIDRRTH